MHASGNVRPGESDELRGRGNGRWKERGDGEEGRKVIGERLPRNERNKLDVKRFCGHSRWPRYRDCSLCFSFSSPPHLPRRRRGGLAAVTPAFSAPRAPFSGLFSSARRITREKSAHGRSCVENWRRTIFSVAAGRMLVFSPSVCVPACVRVSVYVYLCVFFRFRFFSPLFRRIRGFERAQARL